MSRKPRLQRIGREVESFRERFKGKMTGADAVVAAEDFLEDGVRAWRQLRERGGVTQHVPAFALLIALARRGSSQTDEEHLKTLARVGDLREFIETKTAAGIFPPPFAFKAFYFNPAM
jgi:hypothetical protein